MDRFNPDNENPFYFQPEYAARSKSDNTDDAVKQYLFIATKIDEIVRVWLKFILQHVAEQAVDEKTEEWIKATAPLADNNETARIVRILSEHDIDREDIAHYKEEKTKLTVSRIEQLEGFREFNEDLIAMYEEELKEP